MVLLGVSENIIRLKWSGKERGEEKREVGKEKYYFELFTSNKGLIEDVLARLADITLR